MIRSTWSKKEEVNSEEMNKTTPLDSGRADSERKRSSEKAKREEKLPHRKKLIRGARNARVGA
jgi:hypothetical protein